MTATLTSIAAQPIIDVTPIPAHTNEMGIFVLALERVCRAFAGLDLFRLVTYDAGACSKANARAVRDRDLHYLFVLKSSQSSLYAEAELWLGSRPVEWISSNPRGALVVAILRRIAYTLLTLFRSVTQRSDERRSAPWKRLMLDVFTALLTTNKDHIRGLRFRPSS